jgi:hypothetical protein
MEMERTMQQMLQQLLVDRRNYQKLSRDRRGKKPDRRGPKQTEVKEERTSMQADVEALVLCS